MPTRVHLITTGIHDFNALWFSTHVLERWLHISTSSLDLFATESTLASSLEFLCFFTSLTQMIRFSSAKSTEVFITRIASNSVVAKVLRSLFTEFLILFILLVVIDYTWWLHVHDIGTRALDHVGVIGRSDVHSQHFDFTPLLC
jgi:hypothetical protein